MGQIQVVVDFEFNPVKIVYGELTQEIIEIGAVKLTRAGNILSRFQCMVRPEFNMQIEPNITRLTRIHTKDVLEAETLSEALELFRSWIGEGDIRVYSWGDDDRVQILKECAQKNLRPLQVTHWGNLQLLYPKMMQQKVVQRNLGATAVSAGIPFEKKKAHRALYDAEVTAEILQTLLDGSYRNLIRQINGGNLKIGTSMADLFQNIQLQLAY